ncbi:putative nuclease HARBI1 [Acipenser oxyrinchus oxyrinchus]|uniref:Putative nuclease HARBI1 n=1 Tax=Acipenser oxyrinchus oxyrinchus TaxID=40147 RepID=A0AAD8CZC8_ACIOX|nr:putative nuclease HARBI1 [Acipenser oxyrinchus oxyrinchus]
MGTGRVFHSQSSISKCITEVTESLINHLTEFINFPITEEDQQKAKIDFFNICSFPRVIGCIDCTHVPVRPPAENEAAFRNRKRYRSLNVQMICDSKCRIISILANYPGLCHDAYILACFQTFERGEIIDAWLLDKKHSDTSYNEAHCTTRNVIERAFGILKARFKCLDNGLLKCTPTKSAKITMVCAMLHNWTINRNMPQYDIDDQGAAVNDHADCAYYTDIPDVGGETCRDVRNVLVRLFFYATERGLEKKTRKKCMQAMWI